MENNKVFSPGSLFSKDPSIRIVLGFISINELRILSQIAVTTLVKIFSINFPWFPMLLKIIELQ